MVATRSLVATELGPVVGMTSTTVTFLAAFCRGGETEATPGTDARSLVAVSATATGFKRSGASTTTSRGPLIPGPKPRASRS